MSKNKYRHRARPTCDKCTSDDCVCDVVRRIVKAQNEVGDNCCTSGCERSVRELLSGGRNHGPANTTIPFILYCKGTCKPFIGSGVFQASHGRGHRRFFECVETPVFRAKSFVKGSDCCVRLELLMPVNDECGCDCSCDTESSVCPFFPEDSPVTDFQATGICITVDLEHFVGITCLDPITPIPAYA
ncbi:spore coat protein [Virgibacillus phasianinus]|uniref:Spore coat protein n=1 Tax=Virgibacillus phasianinus TaxID=2017483 RepID=A0A220TYQ2_9BACI|nr:CotY/CotZ family spore coat protein [Virgibacillus phasianinus]ASK61124.1 spore coat protein [Virgibacillus phasianinus]